MTHEVIDIKKDFTKILKSTFGCSQPNESYEIYNDSDVLGCLTSPEIIDNEKCTLSKLSKKISKSLDFTYYLHIDIASRFNSRFTDEQLRCIIHSILNYQKTSLNRFYDVRRYTHQFIMEQGDDIYSLGDLRGFKASISRTSLIEFEIFENLILELLDENDSVYIFKKLKDLI